MRYHWYRDKNMIRYYTYTLGDRVASIRRLSDDFTLCDRWNGKEWVPAPSTVDAMAGFASDSSNYDEISEVEAKKLMATWPLDPSKQSATR